MKKQVNIKKLYLFTFISFVATTIFLYFFAETAPQFYTGFDSFTNKNVLSIFADIIFKILLLVNFIGAVLCIIYSLKILWRDRMEKIKSTKIVMILMIISMIIILVSVGFNFLPPPEARSIGIIGGADGPTAVFITSSFSPYIFTDVLGLGLMAGMIYLFFAKKARK